MNITVSFPVYIKNQTHLTWLNKTTQSIRSKEHDLRIFAVENYVADEFRPIAYQVSQNQTNIIPWPIEGPQSVAKAWNEALRYCLDGTDYLIILNTDIVLKSNAIDRLVAFAQSHPEAHIWTGSEWADEPSIEIASEDENFNEHPHFSFFMVRPEQFAQDCGLFDEHFIPAYLEDNDMAARMGLAGYKAYTYGGAKFYHAGSRTIKSDHEAWNNNLKTFPQNQAYFIKKWGHPPVGEVEQMKQVYYSTPFNQGGALNEWSPLA